jgi:hypothetical protein
VTYAPPQGGGTTGTGGDSAGATNGGSTGTVGGGTGTTDGSGTSGGGDGDAGAAVGGGGDGDAGVAVGGGTSGDAGVESCKVESAQPPAQSGVVYISHYQTNDLRIYRVDGMQPQAAGVVDLKSVTHDMTLDPYNDLLFVAHDTEKRVSIHQLYRPQSPQDPVILPTWLLDLSTSPDLPRFVRVDPLRKRLYIFASVTDIPGTLNVHVYDIANLEQQQDTVSSILNMPMTVSMDIDPLAGVLFAITDADEMLRLYDIADGTLQPMAGPSIALKTLYPQTNNTGFSARNLRVNPWQGRIYAARAQGAMSEIIAFGYPPAISLDGTCPKRPYHGSLFKIDDYFDVDQPVELRPNLLDAYVVNSDPYTGTVVFTTAAWSGKSANAMMIGMDSSLQVKPGCAEFEGFGCFYKQYYENQWKDWYQISDGASCLDYTHKVAVGTSYVPESEVDPGQVFFFKYDDSGNLSRMVPFSGGAVLAGGLPITALCH